MSEIQRYRINAVEFIDGRGWVKVTNSNRIGAIDQSHKKGGWCKWSDVKALQTQLADKDQELNTNRKIRYRIEKELEEKEEQLINESNILNQEIDKWKAEVELYKEGICIFVREKWGDMHIDTDEEAIKTFLKYFNEEAKP